MKRSIFCTPHSGSSIPRPPKLAGRRNIGAWMGGIAVWVVASFLMGCAHTPERKSPVGPIPEPLRRQLGLDPFYKKHLNVAGFSIVSSERAPDEALQEAGWIIAHMLQGRADILEAMASNRVRLVVMGHQEFTTDIPEHAHLQPKLYWDRRARGLGPSKEAPIVSCATENLLGYPGDPYASENILIHEFAHAIHDAGLQSLDPTFDGRLEQLFQNAQRRGLWKGTYAASNRHEYWAEAVQSWFDNNRENDALHNHVNTRAELQTYDPGIASLCLEVFGDRPWRYYKPEQRPRSTRLHLLHLDPDLAPRFRWREAPITDKPRVTLQTDLGEIELELNADRAPITTQNFLKYALDGFYHGGQFHRTVRSANQRTHPVPIQVIQAKADPSRDSELLPPIPLERTRDTGLRHVHGAISMARVQADTAQHHFFISVGDQPELDFGGRRNPDGQGFAVFGRVIRGMEVVEKIHQSNADGESLAPPIRIQRAIRTQ